jgi:tripartite-type tricarboxylate transporter receptor subunit TctC
MKLPRRRFLHLAAGAAALPAVSRVARAQAYPTRPVHIVVDTAPGGAPDIIARLMGPWLAERLGQPFVIENRPGGGSNIGTEAVVRASPDGYTLLLVDSSAAINATLYDKLNFVFLRDIAPIGGILRFPYVMVIHPSVPAKTVPEFVSYAKVHPGRINMGSPGIGSGPHVAGELFKIMAGVDMVHVPYRGGGPVMADLLGGQVQVLFGTTSLTLEQIRAGKLTALAVTTAAPWDGLPAIPTVGTFVSGYEASSVYGLGAPKGASTQIVERLNAAINVVLSDTSMRARLADLGGTILPGSPADFGKLLADETEKWGKVIRAGSIKPE